MSDGVVADMAVLRGPENMGAAVGISLLSCVQTEICHILFIYYENRT